MATDTTNPSDPGGPGYRRPLTIDLPAEAVSRRAAEREAGSGEIRPADESGADIPAGDLAGSGTEPGADATTSPADRTADDGDDDWRDDQVEGVGGGEPPASAFTAAPPAAQPAPTRRRTSFLALLTAAILGGLLSAAALWGLDRAGYLGRGAGPADPELARLRDEVAGLSALRGEVAQLQEAGAAQAEAPPGAPVDLAPLQGQVAALEQAIAELRDRPAGEAAALAWPEAAAIAELRSRVAVLEQSPGGGSPGAPSPALEARVAELAGQLETLQRAGPAAGDGSPATPADPALAELPARVEDIGRRLGALEERPPVEIAPLQAGIDELRTQVAELSPVTERLPRIEQQLGEITTAQEAIPQIQAGLDELRATTEALAPAERVAALEATVGAIAPQAERAEALGPAVAATALGSALDSGAPFRAELDALRGLGLDDAALAGLEPHADRGLPTLAALQRDFEAALETVDLSTPVPARAGTVNRLFQSARNLVEVRPANPVAGDDPSAVVARMRGAVEAGDLQTALNEWNALPETPKTALAGWAERAGARLAAEQLVGRLRSDALSRIARGS